MRALQDTGVPVPRMLGFCETAEIIGTPFYVMEHIEGRVFWDPTLPELSAAERAALYDDMNRIIAKLHDVDPAAIGLGDFGRPGHCLQRQIARWSQQYQASQTQPIAEMDRLIQRLPEHLPPTGGASIVHGDLRIDNRSFIPTNRASLRFSIGSSRPWATRSPTSAIIC